MPGLILDSPFQTIQVKELHPTFAAEIHGVDFSKPISDKQFEEIRAAVAKYGVCVFRETHLDDTRHVEFSRKFGELDDVKPYINKDRPLRFPYYELFDAGNVDENGNIRSPDSPRAHHSRGNLLFHVDSSYNPRRASYSLLRAYDIPPPGYGGNTDFADTRTAFADLPESVKQDLLDKDYVAAHSLFHSRKIASPVFFKDMKPLDHKMHLHKLVQRHEPSDRMNLYIAAHVHHIEGLPEDKSDELLEYLKKHAGQEKYVTSVPWLNKGDLVIWDNTCVMHRAAGGKFEGKFKRDLRRTTVHDASSTAWGLNEQVDSRQGFNATAEGVKTEKVEAFKVDPAVQAY